MLLKAFLLLVFLVSSVVSYSPDTSCDLEVLTSSQVVHGIDNETLLLNNGTVSAVSFPTSGFQFFLTR